MLVDSLEVVSGHLLRLTSRQEEDPGDRGGTWRLSAGKTFHCQAGSDNLETEDLDKTCDAVSLR